MIPIVMGTVVGHICYNLGVQGPGWQKLCEGTKGLRRKFLYSDENFKP